MKTSRRLVIHAGQLKTGSTSIQHALARREIETQGKTWDYPIVLPKVFENHHELAKLILRGYEKAHLPSRLAIRAISLWLSTRRADTIVLSAETLNSIDPKLVARAAKHLSLSFDQVQVVMYVRPHLGAMTSTFTEFVKNGAAMGTMDERLQAIAPRFLLARKFAAWRDAFGDQLVLRPFIRSELKNGSAVDDFAATLFPGATVQPATDGEMNVSLGIRDLMRLKVWHRTMADLGVKKPHALGWPLGDLMMAGAPKGTERLRMHKSLADNLAKRFAKDAADLDREFFGGRNLFAEALERERAAAIPEAMSVHPEDWLPADEVNTLSAMATSFVQAQGGSALWRLRLQRHYIARQRLS